MVTSTQAVVDAVLGVDPTTAQVSGWLIWTVLLPAAGALVNGLFGARLPRSWVSAVGCGTVLAAALAATQAVAYLAAAAPGTVVRAVAGHWLRVGSLHVDIAWHLDALSAMMLMIILWVGLLIHLYSVGYMAHEAGVGRYFAALNLFVAAMLVLVLADSLPWTFVGWEGVGLASYLLIGFWFDDPAKARAGQKAFVVNRIGDMGFIGAMMVLWRFAGSLEYTALAASAEAHQISNAVATATCLLLLLAAAGKSAQLPLCVWLPDAMAGPTPVSALIHAATMVTAGIYLMARCGFLFILAPTAMLTAAWVGTLTALFAATVAVVQTDIKKVLAYSTVSQLGLMVLAAGVGAWATALTHVLTHALFKACLFLGAGAVIHNLAGEQDIRRMGGLFKHMRWTAVAFICATLAIVGVPPTSGFVSKDAILHAAFTAGEGPFAATFATSAKALWLVATVASGLTAFYMARLVLRVFFGDRRWLPTQVPHDAPASMRWPLALLGAASLGAGAVNWPPALWGDGALSRFLAPSLAVGGVHVAEGQGDPELLLMGFATAVAAVGILLAWWLYGRGIHPVCDRLANDGVGYWFHQRLTYAWHLDGLLRAAVARPLRATARWVLSALVERRLVGGVFRGVQEATVGMGFGLSLFHNGNVQRYLAVFAVGAAILLYGWFS